MLGYGLVMLAAMYTTALANCYSLLVNYDHSGDKRAKLLVLILLPTVFFAACDFGLLNIEELHFFAVLLHCVKDRNIFKI